MRLKRWINAALRQIHRAARMDVRDIPPSLWKGLTELLREVDHDREQQQEAHRQLRQQVGSQYRLLRAVAAHGQLPPDLAHQIDAAAPAGVVPFTPEQLWAVQATGPDELVAMRDLASAELFAAVANQIRELQELPATAKVVRSPWTPVDHWKAVATLESVTVTDAQAKLNTALRQIDDLTAQIDTLRKGRDEPALRGSLLYTTPDEGGRYVRIGRAIGNGCMRGRSVIVYRCANTAHLFYSTPEDFEQRMQPLKDR